MKNFLKKLFGPREWPCPIYQTGNSPFLIEDIKPGMSVVSVRDACLAILSCLMSAQQLESERVRYYRSAARRDDIDASIRSALRFTARTCR